MHFIVRFALKSEKIHCTEIMFHSKTHIQYIDYLGQAWNEQWPRVGRNVKNGNMSYMCFKRYFIFISYYYKS